MPYMKQRPEFAWARRMRHAGQTFTAADGTEAQNK